ncbi:Cyclochlorotine biosynthesis protein O [Lachnellula suecica]|uniref:Cyclochlorotine biosynthesis protein O n=1 Tax=Lachnellula suecica TaxID=602035 RepID=A0A8T9C812_9HELO|nr:Cyclochlorotine biosynthesis protein O [Lachnellula suecica]
MAKDYRDDSLEEAEPLNGEDGGVRRAWTSGNRLRNSKPSWIWVAHAVLLTISLGSLALSYCIRSSTPSNLIMPITYSPAQSAIEYEIKQFDLPPVPEGPFVGEGPEVDAAWDHITNSMALLIRLSNEVGDTMVSREEMIKMNMDPNGALEITDPATGKRGFRVAVEVLHQLHCLDLLRQANHKMHYAPLGGDTSAPKHDLAGHTDHCIDALRQFVMCQGDTNVFAFRFPFNDGDPWPDYTTPRVCRNYEKIRRWAIDHTVAQGEDEPEH